MQLLVNNKYNKINVSFEALRIPILVPKSINNILTKI